MNKQNILRLAEVLERNELARLGIGFNMDRYYKTGSALEDKSGHNCGTTACIAGWAVALFNEDGTPRTEPFVEDPYKHGIPIANLGRVALGLSYSIADALFTPELPDHIWSSITPQVAAKTLRSLAETGEVRWDL